MVFAHTYDLPLEYVPLAPSGLHHAPGYTEAPVEVAVGDVATGCGPAGDVAGGEVATGATGGGDVAPGVVTTVPNSGASDHGAITNPAHDELIKFFTRPNSLVSIDKFHRAFTEIQFPRYVHTYDFIDGIQLDGSLSLFC